MPPPHRENTRVVGVPPFGHVLLLEQAFTPLYNIATTTIQESENKKTLGQQHRHAKKEKK
jgi:hypothetical protein